MTEKLKISVNNVTKIFESKRQNITALLDVSMSVREGEFVSLVGPSGCGKSTVIRIIENIIPPTNGSVTIDGVTYTDRIPSDILRKLGFVFQAHNLLPWMTVEQNLRLPLKAFGLKGDKWDDQVEMLLSFSKLTNMRNVYTNELSVGMQQRLGVVRALVHDPEILLMDEPFGALDALTRDELDIQLLDICEKTHKTVIFITHSVAESVLLSDRVYVMKTNPGEIIGEVRIGLPKPRSLDMKDSREFAEYEYKIIDAIGNLELSSIK